MNQFRVMLRLMMALAVIALSARAEAQIVYDSADSLWYEAVYVGPNGITWTDASSAATALGGHLATPLNSSQNEFVYGLVTDPKYWTGISINSDRLGPWLGIYSTTSGSETFVYSGSGAPLGPFHPWGPNQPDGYGGGYQAVGFYAFASEGSTWGDTPVGGVAGFGLPTGYVVQFDTSPVPEPSANALLFAGLATLALMARRRQRS